MDRRAEMQRVLDMEVKRWSEMSPEQLITELRYQFEVQMLENESDYVHVDVSVDDGRLPYSISPLGQAFLLKRVRYASEHLE